MIPFENVLLEVVRCINIGRANLANKGVETQAGIKLDEIVEKIAAVPTEKTKSEMVVGTPFYGIEYEMVANDNSINQTETTLNVTIKS